MKNTRVMPLLQKKFTVDFLQKKKKKNEGEVQQYYVEGSHEPIIPPRNFDLVQAEIKRRSELGRKYSASSIFSTKLICEKEDKFRRANEIKLYVQKMIETKNLVTEWDDTLWVIFLDKAIVNAAGTIEFCFKDGSTIPV